MEVVLEPVREPAHRHPEVSRELVGVGENAAEADAAVAELLAGADAARCEVEYRHVLIAVDGVPLGLVAPLGLPKLHIEVPGPCGHAVEWDEAPFGERRRDANRLQSELLLEAVDGREHGVRRDRRQDPVQIAAGDGGEDRRQTDPSVVGARERVGQTVPPVHVLPEVFPAVEELSVNVARNEIVARPCLSSLLAENAECLHQPELAQETRRDVRQSGRDERRRRSRPGDLDRVVEVVDVMALAAAYRQDGRERLPAAACTAHALLVVEALRRHVALIDRLQGSDVHAHFHGRRDRKQIRRVEELAPAEVLVAFVVLLDEHALELLEPCGGIARLACQLLAFEPEVRLSARDGAHDPAAEEVLRGDPGGGEILRPGQRLAASRAASESGVKMDAAAAFAAPCGSVRIGGAEEEHADVDRTVASGLLQRGLELVEELVAIPFRVLQDLRHQALEPVVAPAKHIKGVLPGGARLLLELVRRDAVGIGEDAQHRVVARLVRRVFLGAIEARPAEARLLQRKVGLAEEQIGCIRRLLVLHPLARLADQLELLLGNVVLP
ncbi:hypothetical protein D3C71_301540 [compost metagenome]